MIRQIFEFLSIFENMVNSEQARNDRDGNGDNCCHAHSKQKERPENCESFYTGAPTANQPFTQAMALVQ